MQKRNLVFSDVATASSMVNLIHGFVEGHSAPEPMTIKLVSGSYFPMLGVEALAGSVLNEVDDRIKDAHPVAVVSFSWWKRSLASVRIVIGYTLTIGYTHSTVVVIATP